MADKRWIGAVVALASVAGVSLMFLRHDPVRRLVRAAPHEMRSIEPRLTGGFPWAPLRSPTRSNDATLTSQKVRLASAAWGVLEATSGDSDPRARHAAAIALLLNGSGRAAMTQLAALSNSPDANAELWSDLAATRMTVAIEESDPALLADALAAADSALRGNASLAEALFNRALLLEHLGLRDHAREAWQKYLTVDAGSKWAIEARQHVQTLAAVKPFKEILEARFEELARDPAAAHALARNQPQDARRFGETKILGQWADAEKSNDRATAEKNLRLARELGAEVARSRGDEMLKQAVAAIDGADAERRGHLIDGHILFRDGQKLFMSDRTAAAQRMLNDAARELELGGSPLTRVAQYFVAHTYHGLGDLVEARKRNKSLLASAPAAFPAHRAQLLWHIGLGHMSDGDWGEAMAALTDSAAIFDRIGELDFAMTVRGLIAEIYDRTGDPDSAWAQRIITLREIGKSSTPRLQMTLDSVSRGAILRKQWPVALSFLNLASDLARQIGQPAIQTEMHLLQARVYAETQKPEAAAAAITQARAAASKLDDQAMREEAMADVIATEAIITTQPNEAIGLLTKAIEHHGTRGRRIRVPEMLLNRARAYSRIGNFERAAADLESGIAAVERHRESLPVGEQRWGVFDAADELFEEAISLALRRDDVKLAFAYSERARARALLDALGSSGPNVEPAAIAPGVALVEYVALRDRLIAFVADGDGMAVVQSAVDRTALEREAMRFTRALETGAADARELGMALRQRLIAPIELHLSGKKTIVFVPGPSLAELPFAALVRPGGGFLIEQYAIVIAPSASVYWRLSTQVRPMAGNSRLLVLANPVATEDLAPLPSTEREAEETGAMYRSATILIGKRATTPEFRRHAPDADVIHMATHGVVPAGTRGRAALLLGDGRLDVAAIASMSFPKSRAVVLAACSTARGVTRAEGTISVARAFLAAGVPSVAATLWPIDDAEATNFFPRLHFHLARGIPPAEALQMTQIEAIQRGQSPSLWAAVASLGS